MTDLLDVTRSSVLAQARAYLEKEKVALERFEALRAVERVEKVTKGLSEWLEKLGVEVGYLTITRNEHDPYDVSASADLGDGLVVRRERSGRTLIERQCDRCGDPVPATVQGATVPYVALAVEQLGEPPKHAGRCPREYDEDGNVRDEYASDAERVQRAAEAVLPLSSPEDRLADAVREVVRSELGRLGVGG